MIDNLGAYATDLDLVVEVVIILVVGARHYVRVELLCSPSALVEALFIFLAVARVIALFAIFRDTKCTRAALTPTLASDEL